MPEVKKQSISMYSSKNCIDLSNCTFQWFSVNPAITSDNDDNDDYINNNKNSNKNKVIEEKPEFPTFTLNIPSFTVQYGELIIIRGIIGQGKSSLCQALLGEMTLIENYSSHYHLSGSISYASQIPWIQNTTIRQNIIYNKPFIKEKYYRVIHACCLIEDFQNFPLADFTFIGQKGINLSGGQKSRIALARSLYLDQDIYILDDVFAALDSIVGRKVFERVVCGLLQTKTRILVTHKEEIINHSNVHQIVTLTNGNITCEKKQNVQEIKNVQSIEIIDYQIIREDYQLLEELIQLNPPNLLKHKPSTDLTSLDDNNNNNNQQSTRNYSYEYTNSTIFSSSSSSSSRSKKSSKISSLKSSSPSLSSSYSSNELVTIDSILSVFQTEEEKESGSVSFDVYKKYAKAAGGFYIVLILVCVQISWQLLGVGSDIFITKWSKEDSDEQRNSINKNILIYTILAIGSGFLVLVRTLTISYFGYYASKHLFNSMLNSLLHAPMWWIDKNPSGRYFTLFIYLF